MTPEKILNILYQRDLPPAVKYKLMCTEDPQSMNMSIRKIAMYYGVGHRAAMLMSQYFKREAINRWQSPTKNSVAPGSRSFFKMVTANELKLPLESCVKELWEFASLFEKTISKHCSNKQEAYASALTMVTLLAYSDDNGVVENLGYSDLGKILNRKKDSIRRYLETLKAVGFLVGGTSGRIVNKDNTKRCFSAYMLNLNLFESITPQYKEQLIPSPTLCSATLLVDGYQKHLSAIDRMLRIQMGNQRAKNLRVTINDIQTKWSHKQLNSFANEFVRLLVNKCVPETKQFQERGKKLSSNSYILKSQNLDLVNIRAYFYLTKSHGHVDLLKKHVSPSRSEYKTIITGLTAFHDSLPKDLQKQLVWLYRQFNIPLRRPSEIAIFSMITAHSVLEQTSQVASDLIKTLNGIPKEELVFGACCTASNNETGSYPSSYSLIRTCSKDTEQSEEGKASVD